MEFIFSQTAPVVCLPCKQTDFITRIIALFRVLLYRVSSKKLLKIENRRTNQLEPEFSFSFDRRIYFKFLSKKLKEVYLKIPQISHLPLFTLAVQKNGLQQGFSQIRKQCLCPDNSLCSTCWEFLPIPSNIRFTSADLRPASRC